MHICRRLGQPHTPRPAVPVGKFPPFPPAGENRQLNYFPHFHASGPGGQRSHTCCQLPVQPCRAVFSFPSKHPSRTLKELGPPSLNTLHRPQYPRVERGDVGGNGRRAYCGACRYVSNSSGEVGVSVSVRAPPAAWFIHCVVTRTVMYMQIRQEEKKHRAMQSPRLGIQQTKFPTSRRPSRSPGGTPRRPA